MQVFVKTLAGKTITVDVAQDDTIQALKKKIADKEALPAGEMRLVYSGKNLDDDRSLNDYDIKNDATLHLLLRLAGGS